MSAETYTPFEGLVQELKALCAAGSTGLLFIATKANKSVQIMMEEGRIVHLLFAGRKGKAGLELMSQIKAGRFKFQEGPVKALPMDLPSTGEILNFLEKVSTGKAGTLSETGDKPVASESTETPAAATSQDGLSDEQKQVFEEILAVYIGPMAAIICEDHLDSVTTVAEAIDALASEIPDGGQAAKFRDEAGKRLG